jgi:hypothetical protein
MSESHGTHEKFDIGKLHLYDTFGAYDCPKSRFVEIIW